MNNHLNQIAFFPPLPRLLTPVGDDPFASIPFDVVEGFEEDGCASFIRPAHWGIEATSVFAEDAASSSAPAALIPVEENTVPSWLWRHKAQTPSPTARENDARAIIARFVGGATYRAWKNNIFSGEADARAFYDEACAALAQRMLAFEPAFIASHGTDWAFGVDQTPQQQTARTAEQTVYNFPNTAIDAIVGGFADAQLRQSWLAMTTPQAGGRTPIRFTDTITNWGDASPSATPCLIDALACRHNDGNINIAMLAHLTRIAVLLLDAYDAGDNLGIGVSNLAAFLVAMAIPYNSDEGRASAASIMALVTAEAYHASALLASLRGRAPAFASSREATLRKIRNHARATIGDANDYEGVHVLPQPISPHHAYDLPLVSAAQNRWHDAVNAARAHGLRHISVTGLCTPAKLLMFTECCSNGASPLFSLSTMGEFNNLLPPVLEGLNRLHLPTDNPSMLRATETRKVFVTTGSCTPDSLIRMAAALQTFVSGNIAVDVTISTTREAEKCAMLAWRLGLKGFTIAYENAVPEKRAAAVKRKTTHKTHILHNGPPALPKKRAKSSATSKIAHRTRRRPAQHSGKN